MCMFSVSADFCSGGEAQTPGGSLLGIMEVNGYTEDRHRVSDR